jgi:hypothetical protein
VVVGAVTLAVAVDFAAAAAAFASGANDGASPSDVTIRDDTKLAYRNMSNNDGHFSHRER